jgi:hypothetical protein
MKKVVKLNENDLRKIVKRVIFEMNNNFNQKMSSKDWEQVWFKLRRMSTSFAFPDFKNYFFSFGGLDFHYNEDDGSLILHPMFRDPYFWRDEYDKGAEVLEKYANKLGNFIDQSNLGLKFEMGPRFNMRIYKDENNNF